MDLLLLQRDLAARFGVSEMTVGNWERGKGRPTIQHMATIIAFLGYDPEPTSETLSGRLLGVRRSLGLTQAELAARLGQDEGQICRWERGRRKPHPWIAGRIDLELRSLEGRPVDGQVTLSFFDLTRWRRKLPKGAAILPETFGERLRARRIHLGLSMSELGHKVAVSRGTIYRLERGGKTPSPKLRMELERVLTRAAHPNGSRVS